MIIDSHAHYTHVRYQNPFRYLTRTEEGYAVREGDRAAMLAELESAGIAYSIEPGIGLNSNEAVLDFCAANRAFPAVGVHPTRSIHTEWRDRKQLDKLAKNPNVIAIGETGLDYHYERPAQHRLRQMRWFLYQLNLSQRMRLPQILHVRDAHRDALRILRLHPARKLGGVVHCFIGTKEDALAYVKLGYHLGIGGSILQPEAKAGVLWEAVRAIPLDKILIETDAPFILPWCKDVIPSKILRKTCNTSLILPEVIRKIAELKGISPEEVETATTANTIRLFALHGIADT